MRFSAVYIERYPIERFIAAVVHVDVSFQILDTQNLLISIHPQPCIVGSVVSRRPSPTKLIANTNREIVTAEGSQTHQ